MAADWVTFITKVSNKLGSQSIKSYDEMADFLKNEYISATVGKATSPYGQIHVKGKDKVMLEGFKKGFKMLYEKGDLSFEDKKTNPEYADLEVQPPAIDASESADQVELDFRDWADENAATIPDFTYSQFFSQYPNFPADRNQAVLEIARKILHQFDGTSSYLQWMYSLRVGAYSDWGNLIMNQVVKLIKSGSDRPLQPGDLVRGYAKYRNANTIYFVKTIDGGINANSYTTTEPPDFNSGFGNSRNQTSLGLKDAFNLIKGDVNVDSMDLTSSAIGVSNKEKYPLDRNDLVEGKIISVSGLNGDNETKVAIFSKRYNRTLIKTLIPGTINRKLDIKEIAANLPSVSLSDKLLQEQNYTNPKKIPDYLTARFITTFTYSARYDARYLRSWLRSNNLSDSAIKQIESEFDDSYQYADEIVSLFSNNLAKSGFFIGNINRNYRFDFNSGKQRRDANKRIEYAAEEERFRELKIRWINELAESAKKVSDQDKPEDPYDIMAKGVLDYWKSCAQQPLSKEPAAPPCVISLPQGGLYVTVYYGSQKTLGDNIRRAFNTGKRFNEIYEKPIASKLVASALAYSFSLHLLELKFVYRGGIPGPNGPVPMLGFVPLVY